MSESQTIDACIKYLFARGCFVWRQNTGAFKPEGSDRFIRFGLKGCADIIGLTPSGRFLAVETKFGKNKQSDSQLHFERCIVAKRGLYILAYSIDDLENHKDQLL